MELTGQGMVRYALKSAYRDGTTHVVFDLGGPMKTTRPDAMDIPGYRLHALKGKLKGRWSTFVSGNWRLTFEFKNGNVELLDYEDYH